MKKIKKVFMIMLVCIAILPSNFAYASEKAIVDVVTSAGSEEKIAAGTSVEITVKLSNLNNMYAAAVEFTYDPSYLEITSIEPSNNIKNGNIFEAYRDTAKDGKIARYGFSYLGADEKGINGATDFVIIKAKAKSDYNLNIDANNLKLQLVTKTEKSMINTDYEFKTKENKWDVTYEADASGEKTKEKVTFIGKIETSENTNTILDKEEVSNEEDNLTLETVAKGEGKEDISDNIEKNSDTKGGSIIFAVISIGVLAILTIYFLINKKGTNKNS